MDVAFVTPFYNGRCDGRFGRFHDWIHALREMDEPPFGFDVVALTGSNPDETLSSQPPSYLGDGSSLWGTKANKVEFLLNLKRVRRDLRQGSHDIVHVIRLDSLLYPTAMDAITDNTGIVLGPNMGGWSPIRRGGQWERKSYIGRLKRGGSFRLRQLLASSARYDMAVAFSDYHRRILSEVGIGPERVTTLHPGVNSAFKPIAERERDVPTLLYVGDLSQHKGYGVFLYALAQLNTDVTALIAGQGTPDHDLIRSLGLTDTVTHLGFVDREDLPDQYNAADLFVIPSIDEMGPNTVVEALACGTPVVATDHPGINEYPPEDASVLFSPRTTNALADALETALADLDDLMAAAMAHAPEFDVDRTIDELAGLYRNMETTAER